MLNYFKTKFPFCCHLSVSTEGYQVHIRINISTYTRIYTVFVYVYIKYSKPCLRGIL